MNVLKHIGIVITALAVLVILPGLLWVDLGKVFAVGDVDAVTSATMEIPEQPSGEFYALLNTTRHGTTAEQWRDFFLEKPVEVIMEDIHCLVIDVDAPAGELAERYQARLAENQFTFRRENNLLAVSKAEQGVFDVFIVSKELAEGLGLRMDSPETLCIIVGGAAD